MRGLMQDRELVVTDIIEYAATWHGDQKVMQGFTSTDVVERQKDVLALALIPSGLCPMASEKAQSESSKIATRYMYVLHATGASSMQHTVTILLCMKQWSTGRIHNRILLSAHNEAGCYKQGSVLIPEILNL